MSIFDKLGFPSDVSELAEVGLTPVTALSVAPPRILEVPLAFDLNCRAPVMKCLSAQDGYTAIHASADRNPPR